MNIIRYEAADRSGIPRVYGEGPQADVAYTRCAEAVLDYVQRRPDTGPVSSWLIERVEAAKRERDAIGQSPTQEKP